ncbi:PREDICTED: uncharacterized protein LOC104810708 [Tarenaya hassleriana]|uniref:uncharacterized protein LOC104810708 n=1 Tax=Tarenaya hassleriana TaxID=28532 RepID=UPI00053C78DF|nr:PREDICTED: uncharacterized protein LOC104810708 [Tarenaya hassleriana]
MKSSSSSLSSFRSNSFSNKTQAFRCISGILRGFLCSRASPTYPSDQISDSDTKLREFSSTDTGYDEPGLVARLMGLDSMPSTDRTPIASKSITRNRSLNSVDCLRRDSDQIHGNHRRARSVLALRHLPDFVQLEDENFFILSFEKEKFEETRESGMSFGESKRERSRRCKKTRTRREMQVQQSKTERLMIRMDMEGKESKKWKNRSNRTEEELRQSRSEKFEDKENKGTALNAAFGCERLQDSVESYQRSRRPGDETLVLTEVKSVKDKRKCLKEEKDLSPVSVLDHHRFVGAGEMPESENAWRRRLSPELEASEADPEISPKRGCYKEEAWPEICRITETEMEGGKWDFGRTLEEEEEVEGIREDVASLVLDQLLQETISHLADALHCKSL